MKKRRKEREREVKRSDVKTGIELQKKLIKSIREVKHIIMPILKDKNQGKLNNTEGKIKDEIVGA